MLKPKISGHRMISYEPCAYFNYKLIEITEEQFPLENQALLAKIFILVFYHYMYKLLQNTHDEQKIQLQQQGQIQPMLSTIFKERIANIPQAFGSFVDGEGAKYCAISALLKYLGYDMTTTATLSKEIQDDNKNNTNIELIPSNILERVEDFALNSNFMKYLPKCSCSKPDYYYYSLASLLIHLNDYHKMTFTDIGNWLERKGL